VKLSDWGRELCVVFIHILNYDTWLPGLLFQFDTRINNSMSDACVTFTLHEMIKHQSDVVSATAISTSRAPLET
jgi:hypothetical protein